MIKDKKEFNYYKNLYVKQLKQKQRFLLYQRVREGNITDLFIESELWSLWITPNESVLVVPEKLWYVAKGAFKIIFCIGLLYTVLSKTTLYKPVFKERWWFLRFFGQYSGYTKFRFIQRVKRRQLLKQLMAYIGEAEKEVKLIRKQVIKFNLKARRNIRIQEVKAIKEKAVAIPGESLIMVEKVLPLIDTSFIDTIFEKVSEKERQKIIKKLSKKGINWKLVEKIKELVDSSSGMKY